MPSRMVRIFFLMRVDSVRINQACDTGRYREDCSEYLLSSLATGNTSELQGQVSMAASVGRCQRLSIECSIVRFRRRFDF